MWSVRRRRSIKERFVTASTPHACTAAPLRGAGSCGGVDVRTHG